MSKLLLCALLGAAAAWAQSGATADKDPNPNVFLDNHRPLVGKKQKAPTSRTVTGKVVDDTGQPLEGALVTLVDTKSNAKTTAFTKRDGRYSFEDLAFTTDYELRARYKDSNSATRKLSQYDHTANVVRILEIPSGSGPDEAAKK